MAEERYDIIVRDQVAPSIKDKLLAIAGSARSADSSIDRLNASLRSVDGSSLAQLQRASAGVTNASAREMNARARLEAVAQRQAATDAKVAAASAKLATESARTAREQARAEAATSQAAAAATRAAAAQERLSAAQNGVAASTARARTAQAGYALGMQGVALSTGAARAATTNMVAQLNDIAVSLGSGQAPLTVFLQQGSQIATIYGPGTGVTAILRLAVTSLYAFLAPFAPIIAAVGVAAGAIAILQNEIQKATGVNVTFGQTLRAVWATISEGVYGVIQPAISAIAPIFETVYNAVIAGTKTYINTLIATWATGVDAVTVLFETAMASGFQVAMDVAYNIVLAGLDRILAAVAAAAGQIIIAIDNAIDAGFRAIGQNAPSLLAGVGAALDSSIGRTRIELDKLKRDGGKAADEAFERIANSAKENFSTDYAGKFFDNIAKNAVRINAADAAAEAAKGGKGRGGRKGGGGSAKQELSETEKALEAIRKPLDDYKTQIAALNELLAQGKITQEQFNAAVGKLALVSSLRDVDKSLPGFANEAEIQQLQQNANEQISIVQLANEAKILNEQQTADRIRAIRQQLAMDTVNLTVEQYRLGAAAMSTGFADMANVMKGAAGEQSAIYKSLFAVSKAFAIAEASIAIYQNIAKAMAVGFPQNLPFIAAAISQGAGIISSIQSIAAPSTAGFMLGGYTGNMPTTAAAGIVHGREYVMDAAATKRIGVGNLEAMRAGRALPSSGGKASSPSIKIENYGTPQNYDVQQISRDEIILIARDQVRKEAPKVVSADIKNPNSRTSKALQSSTTASRKR